MSRSGTTDSAGASSGSSRHVDVDAGAAQYIHDLTSNINDAELSMTGHDRQLFTAQVSKMYYLCCDLYGTETAKRKTAQFASDFIHVCKLGTQYGQQSPQYIAASHQMHQRVLQNDNSTHGEHTEPSAPVNPLQQLYQHVVQLRTSILASIPVHSEKEVRLKGELEQKLNTQLKHLNDASNKFMSTDADSIVYKRAIAQLGWSSDAPNNPLLQLSAALSDTGNSSLSVTDKLQRVSQQLQALSKAVSEQQKQINGNTSTTSASNSAEIAGKHAGVIDTVTSVTVNGTPYTYVVHGSAASLPDQDTVLVETNDAQLIKVSRTVATRCNAVKTKLDKRAHAYARLSAGASPSITLIGQPHGKQAATVDTSNTIPTLKFPNVSMSALRRVLDYCATAFPTDSQRFLAELRATPISGTAPSLDATNNGVLCELASASFYLDCTELVEMSCRAIAESIRGKSPQAIRQAFNIQSDFSASEERAIKKEMVAQAMFAPTIDQYLSPAQIAQTVMSDAHVSGSANTEAQRKFASQLSQQINQLTHNQTSELKPIELPHTHNATIRDHAQSLLSSTLPLDKLPANTTYVSSTITTNLPLPPMECGCEGCHSLSSRNARRNVLNMNLPTSLPLPPLPHNTHSHYHHNNALMARNKLRNKLQSSRNAANAQNGKTSVSSDASPTHDNNLSVDELLDFINQADDKTNKPKAKGKTSKKQTVVSKAVPEQSGVNAEIEQVLQHNTQMQSTAAAQAVPGHVDVVSAAGDMCVSVVSPSLAQPFKMPTFNDFQLGTKSGGTTPSHSAKLHHAVAHDERHNEQSLPVSTLSALPVEPSLSAQIEQRLAGLHQWQHNMQHIESDVNQMHEAMDAGAECKTEADAIDESVRLHKVQKYLQQLQLSLPHTTAVPFNHMQSTIIPTRQPIHQQYSTVNHTRPINGPAAQPLQSLANMHVDIPPSVVDVLSGTTVNLTAPADTLLCHCVQSSVVPLSVNDAMQPVLLVCDKCGLLPPSAMHTQDSDRMQNKAKSLKVNSKPVRADGQQTALPAVTPNQQSPPATATATATVKACDACVKLEKQLKSSVAAMEDKFAALEKTLSSRMLDSEKQLRQRVAEEGSKRAQLESVSKKIDLLVTEQIHTIDKHRDRIDDAHAQLKQHRAKTAEEIKAVRDSSTAQWNESRAAMSEMQNSINASVSAALQSFDAAITDRYKPMDAAIETLKQQLQTVHKRYDELKSVVQQQQPTVAKPSTHRVSHIHTPPSNALNNAKMNNNAPVFVPAASPRHTSQHSHTSSISLASPQPVSSATLANASLHGAKQHAAQPVSGSTAAPPSAVDPWARQPINTDEYGLNIGGFGSSTWSNTSFSSTNLTQYNHTDADDNEASRTLRMLGLDDRDTS